MTKMVRRHRIGAVIALVIYFLGTSLIIADCRRLADAKEQEENVSDEGIPHEFYSNSTSSGVQVNYKSSPNESSQPPAAHHRSCAMPAVYTNIACCG